jgi:hypothetical protein
MMTVQKNIGPNASGDATSIQGVDVDSTAPTTNQVLYYDNPTSKWKPGAVPAGHTQNTDTGLDIGGTYPVTAATISGHIAGTSDKHSITDITDLQTTLNQKAARYAAASAPTANHDSVDTAGVGINFAQGDVWFHTGYGVIYVCHDATATSADWKVVPFDTDLYVYDITGLNTFLNLGVSGNDLSLFVLAGTYTLTQDFLWRHTNQFKFDRRNNGVIIDGDGSYRVKNFAVDGLSVWEDASATIADGSNQVTNFDDAGELDDEFEVAILGGLHPVTSGTGTTITLDNAVYTNNTPLSLPMFAAKDWDHDMTAEGKLTVSNLGGGMQFYGMRHARMQNLDLFFSGDDTSLTVGYCVDCRFPRVSTGTTCGDCGLTPAPTRS